MYTKTVIGADARYNVYVALPAEPVDEEAEATAAAEAARLAALDLDTFFALFD